MKGHAADNGGGDGGKELPNLPSPGNHSGQTEADLWVGAVVSGQIEEAGRM